MIQNLYLKFLCFLKTFRILKYKIIYLINAIFYLEQE
jgi:hypothetical protein